MRFLYSVFVSLLSLTLVWGQGSSNMTLDGHWNDTSLPTSGGQRYSDIWGYNAPNGTEVAIMGSLERVYFFDITDPSNIEVIDFFEVTNANGNSNSSIWRDFKTYGTYAYASADQGTSGLLVFDLSDVPDSVTLVLQTQEFFNRAHNIYIDTQHGRLYTAGGSFGTGTHILDLATDPVDPVLLASPVLEGYVHDIHVVDHIGYASHGNLQALVIYDFTDPENPVLLKTLSEYPEPGYNHSSWLDASGTRLVFADETHGRSLKLVNPQLSEHQTTNYKLFKSQLITDNPNSIAHNPFIKGDLCYVAYYHDGVQVFDISDTNNIVKVGYYDTFENSDYNSYQGCWGVYPFLQSNRIIASDMTNGLFVLTLDGGVLPLDFIAFDASIEGQDVVLSWKITVPDDGDQFIIEHSSNGQQFKPLMTMPADRMLLTYQFRHINPGPGVQLYRITGQMFDGSTKRTPIRSVQIKTDKLFRLSPTLVSNRLKVDTDVESGMLSVYSADGRLVTTRIVSGPGRTELNATSWPAGQYFTVLSTGTIEQALSFFKK